MAGGGKPREIARKLGLDRALSASDLEVAVDAALADMPDKAEAYRVGKTSLLNEIEPGLGHLLQHVRDVQQLAAELHRALKAYKAARGHVHELGAHNPEVVRLSRVVGKTTAAVLVAEVGSTGNVDAPQLHFEIRKGAEPVDPLTYLK